MKLIILFGPQAVGKMSVGQELAAITELKLFHNHMTIDLVSPFFSYSTPAGKRLVKLFRQGIFEEVAKSDLEGLIFTCVWEFDQQADWDYINHISTIFQDQGGEIYFVELEADVEVRLERNKSPNRLHHKPSKRNLAFSEQDLIETMEKHRLNSYEGEIDREHYTRINNTMISVAEVAYMIKERFSL
ncbi:shikimate kinase [Paenibacillus albiflavus]|uniref:Shikimate kinase n=1 Tax=Paenibacillus albiflavus TaxID=2545760 RepID=A0A4R4EMZ8_9BACL|nr:AAA family ATPase [Paenibacillus albiflavus]TCZ80953.1 shikimate kinase [Paenibacillus albiflavus]